jgi:hypothetical protein
VDFVETGIEMPGGMTLAEWADHGSLKAPPLKKAGEPLPAKLVPESPIRTGNTPLGGRTAVAHHTGMNTELPRI